MKCINCGYESNYKYCEMCGSKMPDPVDMVISDRKDDNEPFQFNNADMFVTPEMPLDVENYQATEENTEPASSATDDNNTVIDNSEATTADDTNKPYESFKSPETEEVHSVSKSAHTAFDSSLDDTKEAVNATAMPNIPEAPNIPKIHRAESADYSSNITHPQAVQPIYNNNPYMQNFQNNPYQQKRPQPNIKNNTFKPNVQPNSGNTNDVQKQTNIPKKKKGKKALFIILSVILAVIIIIGIFINIFSKMFFNESFLSNILDNKSNDNSQINISTEDEPVENYDFKTYKKGDVAHLKNCDLTLEEYKVTKYDPTKYNDDSIDDGYNDVELTFKLHNNTNSNFAINQCDFSLVYDYADYTDYADYYTIAFNGDIFKIGMFAAPEETTTFTINLAVKGFGKKFRINYFDSSDLKYDENEYDYSDSYLDTYECYFELDFSDNKADDTNKDSSKSKNE